MARDVFLYFEKLNIPQTYLGMARRILDERFIPAGRLGFHVMCLDALNYFLMRDFSFIKSR